MTHIEKALEKKARDLRTKILETAVKAGKGHVPPAFSWVEIAVYLFYGAFLKFDPSQPKWQGRDRFLLSKGHGCLTLYAILSDLNYFNEDELERFSQAGSMLAGHPDSNIPGVELISGSLGHGLGVGAGLALGAKTDREDWRVVTLLGDGECHEGSIWEAAMFAGHHQLNNLIAIIDRNKLSASGFTEDYLSLEPLSSRWEAFGWDTASVNGHSFPELAKIFDTLRQRPSKKPLVIIANTIKGKGVSFMENSPQWHHRMPNAEELKTALQELKQGID